MNWAFRFIIAVNRASIFCICISSSSKEGSSSIIIFYSVAHPIYNTPWDCPSGRHHQVNASKFQVKIRKRPIRGKGPFFTGPDRPKRDFSRSQSAPWEPGIRTEIGRFGPKPVRRNRPFHLKPGSKSATGKTPSTGGSIYRPPIFSDGSDVGLAICGLHIPPGWTPYPDPPDRRAGHPDRATRTAGPRHPPTGPMTPDTRPPRPPVPCTPPLVPCTPHRPMVPPYGTPWWYPLPYVPSHHYTTIKPTAAITYRSNLYGYQSTVPRPQPTMYLTLAPWT